MTGAKRTASRKTVLGFSELRRRAETQLEARPVSPPISGVSRKLMHELDVHQVELKLQNEELMKMGRELEAARDWYRELYETAPVGYLTTSTAGVIIAANRMCGSILGRPADSLVGKRFASFLVEGSKDPFRNYYRGVVEGATGQACELALRREDGQIVHVHLESSRKWRTAASKAGELRIVLIDVTGPRRLERLILEGQTELAHVLRVQSLGELAPALAHELSQPLVAIQAYAGAALNELARLKQARGPVRKIVQSIAAQADHMTHILAQVRRFARKLPPELSPVNINELIVEVVRFVEGMARMRGVRIDVKLDERLPEITADSVGLQQILLNLVLNGFDAMADSPPARKVLLIRSRLSTVTEVLVEVSDHGSGVSGYGPGHTGRIFDEFYSTKPGGLGLGLSISRRIAEHHGGKLSCVPGQKTGLTFLLSLPVPVVDGAQA